MDIGLLIGGVETAASGGRTYEHRDPMTGEVVVRSAAASVTDALAAVDAAAAALPAWAAIGPKARRAMLMRAADVLEAKSAALETMATAETGAARGWGSFNTRLAADMLREAAAMTSQVSGEVIPSDKPGCLAMAMRVPSGVCLGIAPWNAAIILGVRSIAMPLACGNTVVMKGSEVTPGSHYLIGKIFEEAGFPPGVVNVIANDPKDAPAVVEALIAHPEVRRVNFTGSTGVGRIIGELCGRFLKPCLLELGGKNPLVVLDDADLDAAVNAACFSAFMHQGQICMSAERVIVHEAVADAFIAKFKAKAETIRATDPKSGNGLLGSLVNQRAMQHVERLLADARAKGAEIICGGVADGPLMDATIVTGVTPEMDIYQEESFGPSVSVIQVKDDEEALRIANDTDYGLSSAVFTKDINRAMDFARKIQAGICHVNGPTVGDEAQMPFGGVKASGYGRFGGKAAIAEFTDLKWVTIETEQHYPF